MKIRPKLIDPEVQKIWEADLYLLEILRVGMKKMP